MIDLNYEQPLWSVKYPELLGILEDEPLAPKGNVMAGNVCWGGPWGRTAPQALPLVKFENNLIDVNTGQKRALQQRLQASSLPLPEGFKTIPLEKIGVYPSEDRASWPVEHSLRPKPVSR